ncbi:methyltransferase [Streptacidiphilus melanogenes]|uniref:methyltransferase n=1 Tax=Streptacidiphilus melanogenes TaxID=411235 RepID=UPI0005AAF6E6|nr:methyltransferase [Streptacidiphilus melanogenes]
MFNAIGYELGKRDLARFRNLPPQDRFTAFDREWSLLPDVWPGNAVATRLFTSWLPYQEADNLAVVGCGAGVTAVMAALHGCSRVFALDVNPAAVETTRLNAIRHGVDGKVIALTSNLFSALDAIDVFDMIYWNSPFVEAPADHYYVSGIDYAAFDSCYAAHHGFFANAGRHLSGGGRIFHGFSETLGNPALLRELAAETGFRGSAYRREEFAVPTGPRDEPISVDYVLYEFHQAELGPGCHRTLIR